MLLHMQECSNFSGSKQMKRDWQEPLKASRCDVPFLSNAFWISSSLPCLQKNQILGIPLWWESWPLRFGLQPFCTFIPRQGSITLFSPKLSLKKIWDWCNTVTRICCGFKRAGLQLGLLPSCPVLLSSQVGLEQKRWWSGGGGGDTQKTSCVTLVVMDFI